MRPKNHVYTFAARGEFMLINLALRAF